MNEEIKTEDIIKNLRQCSSGMGFMDCFDCTLEGLFHPCDDDNSCKDELHRLAADRLEQLNTFDKTQSAKLLGKINAPETENELLRGALRSAGHMEGTMSKLTIDIKQLLKIADDIPLAEYNGRKLCAGTWHHFKGKDYFVIGIAVHTETDETLVLYKDSLVSSKQYARPLAMFLSEVDREKYPDAPQKYRFERKDSRNE